MDLQRFWVTPWNIWILRRSGLGSSFWRCYHFEFVGWVNVGANPCFVSSFPSLLFCVDFVCLLVYCICILPWFFNPSEGIPLTIVVVAFKISYVAKSAAEEKFVSRLSFSRLGTQICLFPVSEITILSRLITQAPHGNAGVWDVASGNSISECF